jgi:hypothetical protein
VRLIHLFEVLALAGCLPPDNPPEKPKPVDPDVAALVHDWKVEAHVLGIKETLSDRDAAEMHGRVVAVQANGYTTPWHGSCEEATRERATVDFVDAAADESVAASARVAARQAGMAKQVTRYRLTCKSPTTAPALVIYVSGAHAMTCFADVCYLLTR